MSDHHRHEGTCPTCHETPPPLNAKCHICAMPMSDFYAYREAEKRTFGYQFEQVVAQLPPAEAQAARRAWRDLMAKSLVGAFEATDWPEAADRIRTIEGNR